MMRVLVLDDSELRHHCFDRDLRGLRIVHARTAPEAIEILRRSPRFDVAFLDYDLDLQENGVKPVGTGLDVADHIARDLDVRKIPRRIWIHSRNETGRSRMEAILRHAPALVRVEEIYP